MFMKEIMKVELEAEKKLLEQNEEKIQALPEGMFYVRKKRGIKQYYIKTNEFPPRQQYVSTRDYSAINGIILRTRLKAQSDILSANIILLSKCLAEFRTYDMDAVVKGLDEKFREYPREIADSAEILSSSNDAAGQFFTASELMNNQFPFTNQTFFGLNVRSKSECSFAELLYRAGFSFFYEKKLTLMLPDGSTVEVYPDFVVMIKPHVYIIVEHLGLLNDSSYLTKNTKKLGAYNSTGIVSPKNLILTTEMPRGGTDNQYLKHLVEGYFCRLRNDSSIGLVSNIPRYIEKQLEAAVPK